MSEEKEETLPAEETEEEEVEKLAEKIIEGEGGEGEEPEEAPEEYIPEELEPLPPGALDVRAIEIMADISELLEKVVSGSLPESKAVKEVLKLRRRLIPRKAIKASTKSKSAARKSSKKGKSK